MTDDTITLLQKKGNIYYCNRELTCPIGDKMHNWAFQIGDWGLGIGLGIGIKAGIGLNWLRRKKTGIYWNRLEQAGISWNRLN